MLGRTKIKVGAYEVYRLVKVESDVLVAVH